MDSQLWGTFSVADHLRRTPFVADVLLFDRLIVPVPISSMPGESLESPTALGPEDAKGSGQGHVRPDRRIPPMGADPEMAEAHSIRLHHRRALDCRRWDAGAGAVASRRSFRHPNHSVGALGTVAPVVPEIWSGPVRRKRRPASAGPELAVALFWQWQESLRRSSHGTLG